MPVAMKRILAGLACAAIGVGIGYLMLVHLSLRPACDLTRLESLPSPNGRFIASMFRKDCGATTDYVTGVALHAAGQAFADKGQDVVLILKGIVPISQAWEGDDELHLKLPSFAPIFRQNDKWNEVKIAVER